MGNDDVDIDDVDIDDVGNDDVGNDHGGGDHGSGDHGSGDRGGDGMDIDDVAGFVALVTIRVDGPVTQRALVDLLSRDVEEWVRYCPGFVSANYHLSLDGTVVVNYARWQDEASYRDSFDRNPDRQRMRAAITALDGVLEGPSMTAFRLDLQIAAAPARAVG